MKKLILFATLTLLALSAYGKESSSFDGKKVVIETTTKETTETPTNITAQYKGQEYPIFISKNGRCYIKVVSKRTGNEYRKYLEKDISKKIAQQLGVEFKESKINN